ncbi:MAG: ABC transporter permease, partial [Nitrospinaceae bacterium]
MAMKPDQLTNSQLLALTLAECRGAWRRFLFFVISIAIGVGAVMTIKSFSSILEDAIHKESKGLMAADIQIKGSWKQSQKDLDFQKRALPPETQFQFIKELHAMAQFANSADPENKSTASLLVELKSVPDSPAYPMYGVLKTNPQKPL